MGCSDVDEFEHIYGQISTTPSCVYDPLFTRTRMMVVNALKSFGIDSCLYEIPKNDWVDDNEAVSPVTFDPDVYCYLIVTPVDFTGKKLKAYNFVISRMGQVTAYHSSDVFTVIRGEVRPSQRVNKKPHKVWAACCTH